MDAPHAPGNAAVTPADAALVACAALLAGAINAVAGGGTLLTFPALLSVGLSPLQANATSTIALLPAALASLAGYREELRAARPWTARLLAPSVVGGLGGGLLLLVTPDEQFRRLVPFLVLGATALFALGPKLKAWLGRDGPEPTLPPAGLYGWQLGVGIYGGYFGAGIGVLMLAALQLAGLRDLPRMNGTKVALGFAMNLVAALLFSGSSLVRWDAAGIAAAGAIVGGYVGARLGRRLPAWLVRGFVLLAGLATGITLLVRARA